MNYQKYNNSELYLDDQGQYAVDHYKWDDWYDTSYIVLGPATAELDEAARKLRADASINRRVDELSAVVRTESLSPVLWVGTFDPDCNARIGVYRTKRWLRLGMHSMTVR